MYLICLPCWATSIDLNYASRVTIYVGLFFLSGQAGWSVCAYNIRFPGISKAELNVMSIINFDPQEIN